MKKTTIQIATKSGKRDHKAYTDPQFPGLAVHRVWIPDDPKPEENNWVVTHLESGMSISRPSYGWATRKQAAAYARGMAEGADWTQSYAQLKQGFSGKLAGIIRRAQELADLRGMI